VLIFDCVVLSQIPAYAARPWIWANASRGVLVSDPSFCWYKVILLDDRDNGCEQPQVVITL